MDWRIILAAPFVVSFAVLILLAVANRRTILRRTNDGSDQGAEEGWGVVQHAQPITDREI